MVNSKGKNHVLFTTVYTASISVSEIINLVKCSERVNTVRKALALPTVKWDSFSNTTYGHMLGTFIIPEHIGLGVNPPNYKKRDTVKYMTNLISAIKEPFICNSRIHS